MPRNPPAQAVEAFLSALGATTQPQPWQIALTTAQRDAAVPIGRARSLYAIVKHKTARGGDYKKDLKQLEKRYRLSSAEVARAIDDDVEAARVTGDLTTLATDADTFAADLLNKLIAQSGGEDRQFLAWSASTTRIIEALESEVGPVDPPLEFERHSEMEVRIHVGAESRMVGSKTRNIERDQAVITEKLRAEPLLVFVPDVVRAWVAIRTMDTEDEDAVEAAYENLSQALEDAPERIQAGISDRALAIAAEVMKVRRDTLKTKNRAIGGIVLAGGGIVLGFGITLATGGTLAPAVVLAAAATLKFTITSTQTAIDGSGKSMKQLKSASKVLRGHVRDCLENRTRQGLKRVGAEILNSVLLKGVLGIDGHVGLGSAIDHFSQMVDRVRQHERYMLRATAELRKKSKDLEEQLEAFADETDPDAREVLRGQLAEAAEALENGESYTEQIREALDDAMVLARQAGEEFARYESKEFMVLCTILGAISGFAFSALGGAGVTSLMDPQLYAQALVNAGNDGIHSVKEVAGVVLVTSTDVVNTGIDTGMAIATDGDRG